MQQCVTIQTVLLSIIVKTFVPREKHTWPKTYRWTVAGVEQLFCFWKSIQRFSKAWRCSKLNTQHLIFHRDLDKQHRLDSFLFDPKVNEICSHQINIHIHRVQCNSFNTPDQIVRLRSTSSTSNTNMFTNFSATFLFHFTKCHTFCTGAPPIC